LNLFFAILAYHLDEHHEVSTKTDKEGESRMGLNLTALIIVGPVLQQQNQSLVVHLVHKNGTRTV
jgi:hypothetical protein